MKLLKLDARFEDARRVARCLVGSIATKPSDPFGDYGALLCVGNEDDVFYMDQGDRNITECEIVFFHIDTLKFCPFVAMREQVRVNAVRIDGTIVEIGYGYCSIYTADGVADRIPLRNIRLDLGSIERGELEGCEIVEDK